MFAANKVSLASLALLAASSAFAQQGPLLSPLEPTRGIMLGAWLDTAPGKDSPASFNARFGHNIAMVHLAQNLPLVPSALAPVQVLDATNTNAILYLSVYPTVKPDELTDAQINALVQQLSTYTRNGRGVLLRLAPEMNGDWQPYGQRPLAFIAMWRKVVAAVRAVETNQKGVSFIWAPNVQGGYPYGNPMTAAVSPTEFAALDTNKDGRLTAADDGYAPFYPGSDVVDWVGLSTYWFGAQYPYIENALPTAGYMNSIIHGVAAGGNGPDFYSTYAQTGGKPFFITESGAAFHEFQVGSPTSTTPTAAVARGPGPLAIKRAWWRQYLTNTTFLATHPQLKAVCLFEWTKPEEQTMRNFHVTNDTDILAAFKADFEDPTVISRYFFAGSATITTDPSAPAADPAAGVPATAGTGGRNGAAKSGALAIAAGASSWIATAASAAFAGAYASLF
ncbi:hypothetical protein HDU86_000195 [Geranomyces michiganensis]|nr:hypothetical protein HDU86_000195 [Geranomyces michiganensis]